MKIMFVCTGNICRSSMAEGILKKLSEGKNIEVYSCGINAINRRKCNSKCCMCSKRKRNRHIKT